MPRITSGSAKNRNIVVPKIPGIRLTQDVYKLALFSILGERVVNAVCLDLYAGSGSFGLEALSRGAEHCDFVDDNKYAIEAINKNIKDLGFSKKTEVFKQDSIKFVANAHDKYDLVFVDPFYEAVKHRFLLQNIEEVLADDGIIAFSHGETLDIQDQVKELNLQIESQRRFGKSYLTIIKKSVQHQA